MSDPRHAAAREFWSPLLGRTPSRRLCNIYNAATYYALGCAADNDRAGMQWAEQQQTILGEELTRRFGPEAWKDSRDHARVPVLGPEQ